MAQPAELGTPWSYTFRDYLFRPLGLLVIVSGTVAQQIFGRGSADPRFWWFFIPAVVLYSSTLLPLRKLPEWIHIGLLTLLVVSSAALFSVSQNSVALVLAFITSSVAGEQLRSRKVAVCLAVLNSVLCVVLSVILMPSANLGGLQWGGPGSPLIGLATGISVYAGLAQRNSRDAYIFAKEALEQSQRANEAEAREAALEERSRIAREIHDIVGHALSGISLQLDLADALHSQGKDDEANQAAQRARALALGGMTETRRAVQALRAEAPSLTGTLRQLAESEGINFTQEGPAWNTSPEAAQALIRGAQESVTNARRHAAGSLINMNLFFDEESVSLTVFNTVAPGATASDLATENPRQSLPESTGMGLIGMRERASLLGGSVTAGPANTDPETTGPVSGGWQVVMQLPRYARSSTGQKLGVVGAENGRAL